MALTNEQVASLDENSVLRVVQGHGLLGTEGTFVRFRADVWYARRLQRDYVPAQTLEGLRIDGSWYPDRFDLVEPQAAHAAHLTAGTLLRCIDNGGFGSLLVKDQFYRVHDVDQYSSFVTVTTLDGEPVTQEGATTPFGFFAHRFVYYPDSAPAEPTTEKGTTMSDTLTTRLTRETAATLPIGARVVFTESGERQGKVFILDRAGIDSDGDLHGTFEGGEVAHFLTYAYFGLPVNDTLPATVPLTIEVARTLPIGAVLIRTDEPNPGSRFTLDVAGVDSDGDFHGSFEGESWGNYQRWNQFALPSTTTPQDAPSEPTANPLAAELAQVRRERNAFESDLNRVIDALREEAKDREWCSDYDRFMERLGFEARCNTTFTVRHRAYIEWETEVEASSEDDAREKAENDLPSYVRDLDSPEYLDLESVEVIEVEEQ